MYMYLTCTCTLALFPESFAHYCSIFGPHKMVGQLVACLIACDGKLQCSRQDFSTERGLLVLVILLMFR